MATMRMSELSERSGLPRTTIHHYAREGLLPPARKSAPNAAVYGEEHVARLRLIAELRSPDMGELGIPQIRRVLEYVAAGVDVTGAVRLVAEGVSEPPPEDGGWEDVAGFATAAAVPGDFARESAGIGLIGRPDGGFGLGDYLVVRAAHAACADGSVTPGDLLPLADLMGEVGNYAGTLVRLLGGETPDTSLRPALRDLCEALLWRASRGAGV